MSKMLFLLVTISLQISEINIVTSDDRIIDIKMKSFSSNSIVDTRNKH